MCNINCFSTATMVAIISLSVMLQCIAFRVLCCGVRYARKCSLVTTRKKNMFDYTGCSRRNGQNFGRVFLMLNYTDVTQNTYIQSWTVREIMAIEKCGLLGCPRTVQRPWRHTLTLRMPGNETTLANIVMQSPWRDNGSAAACLKCLVTLRTNMTWVRVFL